MDSSTWRGRGLIALVSLLWLVFLSSSAQHDADTVYIQNVNTNETDEGIQLDLYFSLIDSIGNVVPSASIRSSSILLDDGTTYDAQITQPMSNYYIVFVLDTSGSMGNDVVALKESAERAIQNAPQGALFSVVRFDQTVETLLDRFTADRNQAINAVRSLPSIGSGGSCLYDALFQAVDTLSESQAVRPVVVLFTDGQDEMTFGRGDRCSVRTYNEVVTLAQQRENRIAIHAIGKLGERSSINRDDLSRLATQTGGFSVFGTVEELGARFDQIMVGLNSQLLASTVVYPAQGEHSAILRVTLADGTVLNPGIARFTSTRSHIRTPTPAPTVLNPTSTLPPPILEIVGIQADVQTNWLSFQLEAVNDEDITEYLFRFNNLDTGLQQQEMVVSAPLPDRIRLSIPDWPSACYTIRASAYATDGERVAVAESDRFCYIRPTPTATASNTNTPIPTLTHTATPTATSTVTNTPVPLGATLNSVQYDPSADVFRLRMTVRSPERIDALRIEFFNAQTGQLTGGPVTREVTTIVEIPATDFAEADYRVTVTSLNELGEVLVDETDQPIITSISFLHVLPTPTPTSTPTPTPTETPTLTETPTSTPVVAIARIQAPRVNEDFSSVTFPVEVENESEIQRYDIEFIDSNGIVQLSLTYDTPPHDIVTVPLSGINNGIYTVVLRPLDEQGRRISDESTARITVEIPSTPTPAPTSEPSAFPPQFIRDNTPIVIPLILGLIAGLVFLLVRLLRDSDQPMTGTGFLEELTRAQEAKDLPIPENVADTAADPDATNFELQVDPEATNAILQMPLPSSSLHVSKSLDLTHIGETITITHVPFIIGRKGECDLSFKEDRNVSGRHANITYVDGTFYLSDLGSTHGTILENQALQPHIPVPLHNGAHIILAVTTVLNFYVEIDSDLPDDRGSP